MDKCIEIFKSAKPLEKLAWNGGNLLAMVASEGKIVTVIDDRKPGHQLCSCTHASLLNTI